MRKRWREEYQKAKGPGTLRPEKGNAAVVFQIDCRGVAFPACPPNVSTSSRPPYLQLWRWWLTEEGYRCHCFGCILPATAVLSLQTNACSVTLLCCNAIDSSFLSSIHSLPLSAPVCLFSYVFYISLHSHTDTQTAHSHTWGARIQMGCLP